MAGRVTFVAPHGHYSLKDTVLELEFNGERKKYTMLQVRQAHTRARRASTSASPRAANDLRIESSHVPQSDTLFACP